MKAEQHTREMLLWLRDAGVERMDLAILRRMLTRISHQATETDSVDHSGRRFEAWRLPRASELVPMWTFLRFFSSTVTD